jgi:hypothetical protein
VSVSVSALSAVSQAVEIGNILRWRTLDFQGIGIHRRQQLFVQGAGGRQCWADKIVVIGKYQYETRFVKFRLASRDYRHT